MLEIRQITDQMEVDPYVERVHVTPFLQSWYWGEVMKTDGHTVDRVAVVENDKPVCIATMQIVEVPFGEYMYMPRGPVWFGPQTPEAWDLLVSYIQEHYPKMIFVRIETEIEESGLKNQNIRKSTANQPRDEWAVELNKTEDELLADMKQKTRYNMRLAQKKKVTVRQMNPEEIPAALNLLEETAKRQHITFHDRAHYEAISKLPITTWLGGFFEDTLIVAHQLIFFGDTVMYLHGGSSRDHQKVMAPHLLHWREIQLAKKEGFLYFNFGGIAPHNQDDHPLASLTRFKKGFGGRALHFPPAYDVILRAGKYRYFTVGKRIRRSAFINRLLP